MPLPKYLRLMVRESPGELDVVGLKLKVELSIQAGNEGIPRGTFTRSISLPSIVEEKEISWAIESYIHEPFFNWPRLAGISSS